MQFWLGRVWNSVINGWNNRTICHINSSYFSGTVLLSVLWVTSLHLRMGGWWSHTACIGVKHTQTILCDGNIRADDIKPLLTNTQSDDLSDKMLMKLYTHCHDWNVWMHTYLFDVDLWTAAVCLKTSSRNGGSLVQCPYPPPAGCFRILFKNSKKEEADKSKLRLRRNLIKLADWRRRQLW